jgi:hypothetical protein
MCCDLIYCRRLTTITSTNPVGASTIAQESVSAWRSCQTSPSSTTPSIAPSSSNTSAIARRYDPGSLRGPSRSCHARVLLLLLMVQCALWLASMLVARLSAAIQQIRKQPQVGSTQCAMRESSTDIDSSRTHQMMRCGLSTRRGTCMFAFCLRFISAGHIQWVVSLA